MNLYIFNPDTELALANNTENYMPSARVRKMEQDLEILPMWYSEKKSNILVSSRPEEKFVTKVYELFDIEANFIPLETPIPSEYIELYPWGWNPTLRKQLINRGIPKKYLPTTEFLSEYRALSGRDKDVEILKNISHNDLFTATVIDNIEDCCKYAKLTSRCIFKSPWSGSGKGLLWCYGKYDDKSMGWCNRVIKEQGFVTATPIYDKLQDFAIEYYSDGQGNIKFIGYSLFDTNNKGAYNSSILQSNAMHRTMLAKYIQIEELDNIDIELRNILSYIYGNKYKGYIGVDMMICRINGKNAVHPCVEVNMRMNMGVFCSIFAQKYLTPECRARFSIDYYKSSELLQKDFLHLKTLHPLKVSDKRFVSGFLPLTSLTAENNYMAYIIA